MTLIESIKAISGEMLTVEKIDSPEALKGISREWKDLLDGSETDVVFLLPEWLLTWWKIYGAGKELYVLVVRDGQRIIGIAPLMRTTSSRFGATARTIQFLGTPNIDYVDFIAVEKRQALSAIMGYFKNHRDEWSKIELSQIPEASSTLRILRELGSEVGGRLDVKEIESCSAYVYEGPEAERAEFSFRKSHSIRTALNVFQRSGGFVHERLTDQEMLQRYLLLMFQLHINRWIWTPTPSKFLDDRHRAFYTELLGSMPENISFYCVRHGINPVACSFNFQYKNRVYFYTLAINLFYRKRSPGQVLFVLQGEDYVRQGYDLDYSRGAFDYKNLYANRNSANYQVTIFSRPTAYWRVKAFDRFKRLAPVAGMLRSDTFNIIKTKLAHEFRENGVKGILQRGFWKVVELFRKFIVDYREFFVFRFEGVPDLGIKPKLPVQFKRLTAEDTESIATFYGVVEDSPKHKTIVERFQKNADCFAALYRENIISLYWGLYYTDYHAELNLSITPGSDEVVLCDALTSPIYRGMKVVPYLLAMQLEEYRKKGIKPVVGVARANKSSRKTLANFDFKHIRTMRHLKVFGIKII